ncbi:MAG: glycosyltransferase [Phycisphaerales bacterium]
MSEDAHLIVGGVLLLVSLASGLYWGAGLRQIVRTRRLLPTARDGVEIGERSPPTGRVCVVVPAHNEREKIGALIASLRAQDYADLRVVLALDRCTDGTPEVAREAVGGDDRFEIVEIDSCPQGWAGKVHAVFEGVARSAGAKDADWLLFTDADTVFDPACVRATLAIAQERGDGLLSLLSTLTTARWYERFVQASCGLELVRQYPPLKASLKDASQRRAFANGQFMLFRRDVYEAAGGHAGVRDELLEDIALARRVRDVGAGASMLLADGMLSCAMYDDWAEFRKGWKRIFTEAANRKAGRLRKHAWRVRAVSTGLPLVALAGAGLGAWEVSQGRTWGWACVVVGMAALGVWLVVMGITARAGGGSAWRAPLAGVGAWLTGSILLEAARDLEAGRPTSWGGREYARRAR